MKYKDYCIKYNRPIIILLNLVLQKKFCLLHFLFFNLYKKYRDVQQKF